MNWKVDAKRREAMTAEGYLITWAEHSKHGMYYNAWAPPTGIRKHRKHIEASFDKEKCKTACETHLQVSRGAAAA